MQQTRLVTSTQYKQTLSIQAQTRLHVLRLSSAELLLWLKEQAQHNPLLQVSSRHPGSYQQKPTLDDREAPEPAGLEVLLYEQLPVRQWDEKTYNAFLALENVTDEKGFLGVSVEQIAKNYGFCFEQLEVVRQWVMRHCDPVGIFACDLQEYWQVCLEIAPLSPEVRKTLQEALESLFQKHNQGQGCPPSAHVALFKKYLKPWPLWGLSIAQKEDPAPLLLPEIRLSRKEQGEWHMECLQEVQVKISKKEGFGSSWKRQASAIKSAWEDRIQTLKRLMESLLGFQKDFFESQGCLHKLKPFTLFQAGEVLGLHESTISRAVAGKFFEAPFGIFPFHVLFPKAVAKGLPSVFLVQKALQDLIARESHAHPFSDEQLAAQLQVNYQITLARRTVTKYREELGIPPARLRKASSSL